MKKILILLSCVILPVLLNAQLTGFGTYESPYSGTFEGNVQWNSSNFPSQKVYINGDVFIDNELLTIEAGMSIIFVSEWADLKITGTGQLNASGSTGNTILFSSDDDNDGNYGESGERWGHISFESMGAAGPSLINYCIIEYGDVSSTSLLPANPNQYGGAIHADFSNLTISNTEIRFCRAGWGGGIFVGNGKNPILTNCYIHDNVSTTAGGGGYFWTNSYSTVSNCIISYNSSVGSGGGGGLFIGGMARNVTFINCVISHNSANNQTIGHNIRFNNNTNTPKPKFINSVIWFPANSIAYQSGGSASATDFEYCAIQTPPIAYNNTITLNAINSDVLGPNFADPDMPGIDWSISLNSPLRDAGINSFPGVTIPPVDFIGNPTVGIKDIGAYEVQYSGWKTTASTTDWATDANWDGGVPASDRDVIIPAGASNYPIGSASQAFTVGSGKLMILKPGAKATLGTLINNGTLRLESDATGISSLIAGSYSGNDADVQIYLTGGPGSYGPNWHYISSPFTSLSTDVFTTNTLNLAQWVESMASVNLLIGWVAFDGYVYNSTVSGPTFSNLIPGKGYNHFYTSNHTYNLQGQLTTSTIAPSLSYTADEPLRYGLNLLGNPFSSGLDWDQIAADVNFPLNTSKGIYFNKSGTIVSYINGVGSEIGVTGVIPPMQGFFTKTYATGNSITLPASARVHGTVLSRYKNGETIIPLVRINLSSDGYDDNTVLRFDHYAKTGLDYDFDAMKVFLSDTKPYIYSVSEGTKFAINGQPYPETEMELPLVVNLTTTGNHTISSSQLQGLDNYQITLVDNVTGFNANLKTTPLVTFTSEAGTLTDRFILKVSNLTTGSEELTSPNGVFNIYQSFGNINIQTLSDEWDGKTGSVVLRDLTGKTINQTTSISFSKSSLISVSADVPTGMYVVEIRSGAKRYVGKVVVR